MNQNFIDSYITYTSGTESPTIYHRWTALSMLGAWLGRRMYFRHGHFQVHPNMYVMLMGSPGTRKSTSIKIASSLLTKLNYSRIASGRTTKEKFLLDLAGEDAPLKDDILETNLFGPASGTAEVFIAADEFNNFVGVGNIEFLSMLGELWDYNGVFQNRVKNSKSIEIQDPTVSILAGNTPTGFSLAFPVESIGQGIFSRLLLIYGEPSGRRITFPSPPEDSQTAAILQHLSVIRETCTGAINLSGDATKLLDHIYQTQKGHEDVRFESYSTRRFTHLLKLCIICTAARCSTELSEFDVVYANTILTHAEHGMSKAIGSFGKSKHSDVSHKLLSYLESSYDVVTLRDLWKQVHNDLERMTDLAEILRNLVAADKVIQVASGFLFKRKVVTETDKDGSTDFSLLTPDERKYVS